MNKSSISFDSLRKYLKPIPSKWTNVRIPIRRDLDASVAKNSANCGSVIALLLWQFFSCSQRQQVQKEPPRRQKKKELALKETLYEVALEKLDRQGVEREWKQETMEIEKEMFEHKRRNQSFKHWKQSNEHATDVPKMSGVWREWESKEKKLCCLQTNKRRERIETSKWLKKEVHLGRTCSKQ